jgi:hypothetical protein
MRQRMATLALAVAAAAILLISSGESFAQMNPPSTPGDQGQPGSGPAPGQDGVHHGHHHHHQQDQQQSPQ